MKGSILCSMLLLSGVLFSQELSDHQPPSEDFEAQMENSIDDGGGKSATMDELDFYRMNPVDVNTASFMELTEIPFLPEAMALKILFLRDSAGSISLSDLVSLPGIDEKIVSRILPFIKFSPAKAPASAAAGGDSIVQASFRSRGLMEIHPPKEFRDGEYLGSPVAAYTRLTLSTPRWSGGVLVDKDAGEPLSAGFVSGYVGLDNGGVLKKFVAGDFTLNSGQGLVYSSPRSSSKGGNVVSQIKEVGRSVVPHLATDEYHYFQGAAAILELYPAALTFFCSRKAVAGTVDSAGSVTSLFTSGLFRSPAEIEKKNALNETAMGGIANVRVGRTSSFGFSILEEQYDKQVALQAPSPFLGRSFSAFGMNADFAFESYALFGEVAGNSFESRNGVAGFIGQLSNRLSLSTQIRSYSDNYVDPHAYGFGEQNGAVNGENGIFLGIAYQASRRLKISMSVDEFGFPSLSGFTRSGDEYVVRCEDEADKTTTFSFQFKNNSKTEEHTIGTAEQTQAKMFEERNQQNIRASCSVSINKWIALAQRVELTTVSYSVSRARENGMLIFTDVNVFPPRSGFTCTSRMVFFETQSYDSRVYEYEDDVRGGYSFPPLYGKGIRWYIIAGWKFLSRLEVTCKYSETFRGEIPGVISDSAGTPAPLDNRVTVQLDVDL